MPPFLLLLLLQVKTVAFQVAHHLRECALLQLQLLHISFCISISSLCFCRNISDAEHPLKARRI
jgi:hypothetical protein